LTSSGYISDIFDCRL